MQSIHNKGVTRFALTNVIEQSGQNVQKLDWKRYLDDNKDLKEAGIESQLDACHHMIHHGIYNNRPIYCVEGKKFEYTFKKKVAEIQNPTFKLIDESQCYLNYCRTNKYMIHPYLKIKSNYLVYKDDLEKEYEELNRTIVNFITIDDVLSDLEALKKIKPLINKIIDYAENDNKDINKPEVNIIHEKTPVQTINHDPNNFEPVTHNQIYNKYETSEKEVTPQDLQRQIERRLEDAKIEKLLREKMHGLNTIQEKPIQEKPIEEKITEDPDYINKLRNLFTDNKSTLENKKILINTHFRMEHSASGDTIMITNIINNILKNNNYVTLISEFPISDEFKQNIDADYLNKINYLELESKKNLIYYITKHHKSFDTIFIRNHELLEELSNKECLNNIVLYGLDSHIDGIKNLNNKYLHIFTQSEQLLNKYIENGISKDKISILPIIATNYDFDLPERKDNEIRLIYSGTLRDEENILEIIEEFQKIHSERPEALLKILYGKIVDNEKGFKAKVEKIIENGVKGITFKHGLSHKDSCYQIATSDIGICWRKNGYGENGEVSTKVKEYELYGLCLCNILKDLFICTNIKSIFNMKINKNNILILDNKASYKNVIYVKSMSDSDNISSLQFLIDNKELPKSNVLLSNKYITPNFIDKKLYPNFKHIHIYGKLLSHIIIEEISGNKVSFSDYNLCENEIDYIKCYKDNNIFLNNIAFIGDEFTFNSLNNITNVKYISKSEINNINVNKYDFLLCESTWNGKDGTWKYAFTLNDDEYTKELKQIINKFKNNGKKCIFYNKEDPTNYEKFYKIAGFFDIIITTSELCVPKYKKRYPNKTIFAYPFLCNPIIHNPINNQKNKIAYFVGGFYNRFDNRMEQCSNLLKDLIKNNYKLEIINRHYFYPKITRQIKAFQYHINKYEIPEYFFSYEKPCVNHNKAMQLYKDSLFHLNMNTVTDCPTMSSRRLVELLGCGCNILSNDSLSIKYLDLAVFTDVKQINYDVFNNYNIEGFYKTHINYSYISLLEKLFLLLDIKQNNNVFIKISCNDKTKIPEKYKKLTESTKFDFELLINNDKYYDTSVIEKLLVYPYFFNGNVCFTDDKNKYFTVLNSMSSNNCIIKYHHNTNQTLLIPKI